MRQKLAAMYPGKRWQNKVANMSDSQVHAIYMRHVNKKGK